MTKTLALAAIAATLASAALLTSANAAANRDFWYECQGGWQKRQCMPEGVQIGTHRTVQITLPPKPQPTPGVAKLEIKPEGNGAVVGDGGGGGGGGR